MNERAEVSSQKVITYMLVGFAITLLLMVMYMLFVEQTDPASAVCGDGRINCEPWQTGAIYCRTNGIEVLFARSDDSRQGQQALFANRLDIGAAGIPEGQNAILLASNADAYTLHRLSDARIQFTSPGLEGGTLYTFQFRYPECIGAGPVNPVGNTPLPPTITPFPTNTPIFLGAISFSCGPAAGQYSLNHTGLPAAPPITYSLATSPIVDIQNGTFPTGTGTIPFNYSGGPVAFVVSGTYSTLATTVTIPTLNCP